MIDDDPVLLDLYQEVLKDKRYTCYATTNPCEAVELAQKCFPDIIILDIMMPGMDGGTVAAKLRNSPDTNKVPILFLSGILSEDEASRGKEGNYLAKPIDPKQFKKKIDQIVSEK